MESLCEDWNLCAVKTAIFSFVEWLECSLTNEYIRDTGDDDSVTLVTLDSRSELISTETDHEMELLNSGLERLSTGSNDDLD